MSILNFQCETAREVPLKELRSGQDLDPLSWQENFRANYIYIYIYIYIHVLFYKVEIVGNYYSNLFKHSEEPASFLLRNLSSTLPTISAWHTSMIIDSNGQSVIIDVKVDFPIRVTTLKKKLRNCTLQLAS